VSEVSDSAAVGLILADYVATDAGGKIYVAGGAITVFPRQPTGLTLPMALAVLVTVPPAFYGAEAAVEILLEREDGTLVEVGDPPQAMRIGQAVRFDEPQVTNFQRGRMPARVQFIYSFNNGLPLESGSLYRWRVRIDHESPDDWTEAFAVVGPPPPPPGPVFG
jgi:hypothetical protein